MTIITLTRQDTPSRPISLNTDFIAAVHPLRKVVPDASSQTMQTKTIYTGTEVVLSNGTKYNVQEDYQHVIDQLVEPVYKTGEMVPEQTATSTVQEPTNKILTASGPQVPNTLNVPPSGLLSHDQIANLDLRDDEQEKQFVSELKDAGVPVSDSVIADNVSNDVPDDDLADRLRASAATQAGDPDISGVSAPKPAKKAPAKKAAPKPAAGDADA